MRKLFTFLFAALMSVGMFALDPQGDDTWDDATKTLTVNSNPGINAYRTESDIEHVIISSGVTSIGDYAFSDCTGLTSVTIPNSVTSIGVQAFANCMGLTSVTNYALTPQEIEMNVFQGVNLFSCTLYVPAESVSAYSNAFAWWNFDNIQAIGDEPATPAVPSWVRAGDEWDDATKTLTVNSNPGDYDYLGKIDIENLVISDAVTSIGESAFQSCSGLTSVTFGNSVESIGTSAFYDCPGLTSVTIGNSVESIGTSAFYGCSGLTSVTIPNSVTSIGNEAFFSCSILTSVTIPNSVTSIGTSAFCWCFGLETVTINAESLESYGSGAFDNTHEDLKIYVPAGSVNTYKTAWADYADQIEAIPAPTPAWLLPGDEWDDATKTLTVNSNPIDYAYSGGVSVIENLVISDAVTSIGASAFAECTGLTSITIPNNVTSIGVGAFAGCTGLTSMVVASGNTKYDSRGCNAIIETSSNTLIAGCNNTIIPNSVTSIGEGAFYGCTGLTSVTIPNSVNSIGEMAFVFCSGLTSITIPNSVTSIGDWAFAMCSNLETVTINAESLESYGTEAFEGTAAALTIYVPAGSVNTYKAGWADYADKIVAIGGEPANSCGPNLTWEFNPSTGVLTISGTGAMYDYDDEENYAPWISSYHESIESITSVIISDGVTSIGQMAFLHCTGLTSVTIPNSVTSIGVGAFVYCTGLTSVTIPNSVNSIGYAAFGYCTGLTSVTIGNSVTSIGVMAFAYCIGLTSVTIPEGVTSIGDGAFGYVPNIVYSGSASGTPWGARSVNGYVDGFLVYSNNTKTNLLACSFQATGTIEIPNSVTSIGVEAFLYCLGITSITIPNSVTSIGGYAFAECSTLETVTINAESLESYGSYAFDGTAEDLTIYVPAGSVDTYKTAWADYADQIEAIPGGDEPATQEITPNVDPQNPTVYYSTFYDSAKKYELPTGVEAYVADLSGANLLLTKIAEAGEVIPADNAVILKSTVTPFTLTPSDAAAVTFTATNDLQGSDTQIATPANCYVLAGTDGVVGFYHYTAANLNAHKAYVVFSGSNQAPRRMPFIFDAATGVENVQGNVQSTKVIENGVLYIIKNGVKYNAQGQIVK